MALPADLDSPKNDLLKKLPDGMFETNRISVGKDGLTPPM